MNIIAGVCLLLWGVTLLRLGVTRGFGAQLRRFLAICSSNRITAFFAGLGITALLQSSTAAALVVSAFASQGMVNSSTGLAILLGANVGTTLIAQLFSFNVSELMPVLMVAGYLFYSVESSGRIKNIGRIFIGLALMLLSLELIRHGSEPLKESKALPLVLKSLGSDPFFAVLVATVITWLCHSSLAVVLLVMSLVSSGVLPVVLGLYMVLGANVGGAIPPVIATLRDNPDAMRIPVGNVLTRLVGVLAAIPFIDYVLPHLEMLDPNHPRQIVNFHTEFNLVLALVFLPFTGLLNKLLKKALPDRQVADDPGKTRYLNNKDLDIPSVALAAAARETLRMGDIVQKMLEDTFSVLKTNNERLLSHIKEEDDTVDRIYNGIKNYMAKLSQEFMDPKEAQRYVQILTFSTNIEHIGDVIDKNLLPMAQKKIKNLHSFSEAGFKEIEEMHRLVIESIQLAQSLFISGDKDTARRLVQGKEIIRKAEIDGMSTHIHRLRGGVPETIATSSLHLDIIRDYRRINTYITTVAFPILEESGEIHETRLRPRKTKEQINEELSSNT
ncbi:MAG: na+/Pi-cotransporter family protein [Micavibrio aeruginosavorus]|uniref:Na+/Pi-cotransporter family protein n=1 Tax=Micavibrio aeruginosavorus TaxID=349221 RepID=A0A2W5Q3Y5_9BACT|nr:MAG: na+/Pi-cotransporter family protein [Micavibrio aeruginosavorus]